MVTIHVLADNCHECTGPTKTGFWAYPEGWSAPETGKLVLSGGTGAEIGAGGGGQLP
jgi:hypothetical protein